MADAGAASLGPVLTVMSNVDAPGTYVLRHDFISAGLLVAGCINGFVAQIIESLQGQGIESALQLFGISPFELITICIAVSLMVEPKSDSSHSGFELADGAAAVGILIPSSGFSWLVVATYGVYFALRTSARQRAGAYLFAGLAVCALWTSIAAKWFAMAFTTWDASLVRHLLAMFQDNVEQADNIVGFGGGFSIVIILTCATAYALPNSIVFLAAMSHGRGPVKYPMLLRNIVLFSAIFTVANVVRLALMASSEATYEFVHGPVGANLFDAFQVGSVLILSGGVHGE
jgi:hypothetical protein